MEELRTGYAICPAIRRAIATASIHITIFSKSYAESHPCLDELIWILRSSHDRTVIPVFCDVEPRHLRDTSKGPYAAAFQKHAANRKVTIEVVEEWKGALKEAAEISGLVFRTDVSNYAKFLEDIVQLVLKEVKYESLEVATHPVGLDQALEDFENKIPTQSAINVTVVGVVGIGGVGKSTLAKHFFNKRRSDFNRSCYLSNVGEKDDLQALQRQLFSDLLGIYVEIWSPERGRTMLRKSLRGLKVLIVVDDVNDGEKLKSLLVVDMLGAGSLILITCRDKVIIRGFPANTLLYNVKPLPIKYARELFCRHAFLQSKPFEGYEDIVKEFLEICGGLPLNLKVLGEQVAGMLDKRYWRRKLGRFSQGLPFPEADSVINTLKWSYIDLNIKEKEMFLDIGCFFAGEDRELAIRALEGLDFIDDVRDCLGRLSQKCVVEFDDDAVVYENEDCISYEPRYRSDLGYYLPAESLPCWSPRIGMQNQARELARDIARQEFRSMEKPLRLCCSTDIVNSLSRSQDGSEFCRIRGIRIPKGQNPPHLPNNIRGLRLLVVEHHIDLKTLFDSVISADLVWLRLQNCGFSSIPSTISLRNLRVLELQRFSHEGLEDFFNSIDEFPSDLRELNVGAESTILSAITYSWWQPDNLQPAKTKSSVLSSCFASFSRFLERTGTLMTNLNKMVLRKIPLELLPIDFSDLSSLRHLDISGCSNLTHLPESFSKLLHLEYLALRDCKHLSIPTHILGEISTLQYIDFKGCVKLAHLPVGITSQRHLRYLNLLSTLVEELPGNIGLLHKLEQLKIGSPLLQELPRSVTDLMGLKELILFKCGHLHHINIPIEKLRHLEKLELYDSEVRMLPAGILQLKYIKVLAINSCPIVEFSFQDQENTSVHHDAYMDVLRELFLNNTSISQISIPEQVCPMIEVIDLSWNFNLIQVRGFPSTVVRLSLENCTKLKTLTSFSNLIHLKFLNINSCKELEMLNVEGLRSLEEIRAESCWKLKSIEAFSQLERLNCLRITHSGVIWDDILQYFTLPSQISAAMVSANYPNHMNLENLMHSIRSSFEHLTVPDVPLTATSRSPVLLSNIHSHSAILMCFITRGHGGIRFRVKFKAGHGHARDELYDTVTDNPSGGRILQICLWTEDSKLFKDENLYDQVSVYKINCPHPTEMDAEKGWIVTLSSKTQALEVCKQIILEMRSMEGSEICLETEME